MREQALSPVQTKCCLPECLFTTAQTQNHTHRRWASWIVCCGPKHRPLAALAWVPHPASRPQPSHGHKQTRMMMSQMMVTCECLRALVVLVLVLVLVVVVVVVADESCTAACAESVPACSLNRCTTHASLGTGLGCLNEPVPPSLPPCLRQGVVLWIWGVTVCQTAAQGSVAAA